MENEMFEVRRRNLRRLIQMNFGSNQSMFARAIERSESYVNRMLVGSDAEYGKNIGERMARDIEFRLKLPHNWFDQVEASMPEWRVVETKQIHKDVSFVTSDERTTVALEQPADRSEESVRDELIRLATDVANISVRLSALIKRMQ